MDSFEAMEMLKKLKELLDIGAISQDEFDQQKAELMKQISFSNASASQPVIVPEVVKESNSADAKILSMEDIDPKYSKDFSEESFWDKIKNVLKTAGLELIYKALQLYYAMQNPNCPMYIKAAIVTALGYFISPIDLIPDFTPFIGFTDDLAAVGAALAIASAYVDENVNRQAKQTIDNLFGKGTSDQL